MSDDPFADLPGDADRTVIRPRPGGGGRTAAPLVAPDTTPDPMPRGLDDQLPLIGLNPLLRAAAPLLAAIQRLRGQAHHPNPDALRRALTEGVREFEQRALQTGMDSRSLRAARYALCATIDDLVLSTPWGSHSAWTTQSLTSLFHNEVSGGERFFDILDQMEREIGKHGDVVELMFVCLCLGFEGRYRVLPRGSASLAELRDNVFRRIRQRRPDYERELSPHWRGVGAAYTGLRNRVPIWIIGVGTIALMLLMYLGINLLLGSQSDETFARLAGLPPSGPPTIVRAAAGPGTPAAPPPPPAAAPSAPSSTASRLRTFLAPEIKQGLVEVIEDPQTITVRIANRNMFASGEATLNQTYLPLLDRIGGALQDEPGRVLVVGHTDNQPIRTARFPSNWQLSTARADTVARVITAKLSDASRVKAEGHADNDPVSSNSTPEGRQQNRRTDIVVVKPPAAP